jgi:hypothetical protein
MAATEKKIRIALDNLYEGQGYIGIADLLLSSVHKNDVDAGDRSRILDGCREIQTLLDTIVDRF